MANDSEVVDGEGANEKPNSEVSEPGTSPSAVDLATLADTLLPSLEKEIEKRFQSYKDKRFDKITTQVTDMQNILTKYNQLISSGKTPEEAQERLELDQRLEILEQQLSGKVPPENPPGTQETVASESTQAILKQLGLDENNPEVTKVLRESKDLAAQLASFINLSTSQKQTEPNPGAVQPSGGGKTSYESVDQVVERLDVLYRHPSAHKEEIDKLVLRLIELEPKVQ